MTTPRSVVRLRHAPEAAYFFSVSHNFIYAPIPKAACSTLKAILYRIYRTESPSLPLFLPRDYPRRVFHVFMDGNFTLSRLKPERAKRLLRDPEVFKFTFVRDPLARLASDYLNKFIQHRFDSEQWEHTSPTLQRIFGANANPLSCSISFVQFVEHVCATSDQQLDKHWRPMHSFLNLDLDFFIGRVETMSRDFDTIRQHTGLPAGLAHENKTDRAENSETAYAHGSGLIKML